MRAQCQGATTARATVFFTHPPTPFIPTCVPRRHATKVAPAHKSESSTINLLIARVMPAMRCLPLASSAHAAHRLAEPSLTIYFPCHRSLTLLAT